MMEQDGTKTFHIAEWHRKKALKEQKEQLKMIERENWERVTQERVPAIKAFLTCYGAKSISYSDSVYEFDYLGMSCHLRDMADRCEGGIHRPFFSDEDRACYHDMKCAMMLDTASTIFTNAYRFTRFYLYFDKPFETLERVLDLMRKDGA